MSSLFGINWTKKFTDIWEDAASFVADNYTNGSLKITYPTSNAKCITTYTSIYYLLYAKYGNSTISNFDENQFRFKVQSIIYQFGGQWAREQEIQSVLLSLSDDDLMTGARSIYNHSYNPSTAPSTDSLEQLTTIDDQNTTNYKKSKMDAYTQLVSLMDEDVTKRFLDRFKHLFNTIVEPQEPLLYEDSDSEEE